MTSTGCTLGVGCDEAGVCYAAAHGQPEQCPRADSGAWRERAERRMPAADYVAAPWIVYDECDEVYLGAERWVEDLWEAETFSRDGAIGAAETCGGAELSISACPYAWFDTPASQPPEMGVSE